jgi:molybdopterin-guanine dinucleotide biosynthesis protein A
VFGGESLLDRSLRTLRDAGATHLAYVGGSMRSDVQLSAHHVADEQALDTCMLRGIVAALAHAEHIDADRALIIACDLPLLRAASARAVLHALNDEQVDVALAHGEQDHWSCIAIRSSLQAPLRDSLVRGELAVHRAVHLAIDGAITDTRIARVAIDEHELTNMNDVATLRAITDAEARRG